MPVLPSTRPRLAAPRRAAPPRRAVPARPRRADAVRPTEAAPVRSAAAAAKKAAPRVGDIVKHVRRQGGDEAFITVARDGDAYVATIDVPSTGDGAAPPTLVWGTFRASVTAWHAPTPLPTGAAADAATGGARTPFSPASPASGRHAAEVRLPARSTPVTLAFRVERGDGDGATAADPPPTLSVPVGMGPGSPAILGASLARPPPGSTGTSINFAVASRGAASVALALVRLPTDGTSVCPTLLEIDLPPASHRTGDVWHVRVDGLTDVATLAWGWRATGPLGGGGSAFAPGRVLADPYAHALTPPLTLPPGASVAPGPDGGAAADVPAALGSLAPLDAAADAGPAPTPLSPPPALEDYVVLDVDVRTFSATDAVPPERRGTFLGVLDALDAAGPAVAGRVTALHLGGTLAAAGAGPVGPAPLALLAPDPALAASGTQDPLAAPRELCALVDGLHARGVAALFGVEFCYTGEGAGGPAASVSLAGLDAGIYYRPGARVLNCGAPAVRALALASLRHWATAYGADGFVLAHAESLTQDEAGGVLDAPPLADAVAADPVLARRVVVAATAAPDLLPRRGARSFPHWGLLVDRNHGLASLLADWMGAGAHGRARAVADRAAGAPSLTDPAWGGDLPGSLAAARRPAHVANCVLPPGVPSLDAAAAAALGGGGADPTQRASLAKAALVAAALFRGMPWLPASALDAPAGARFLGALLAVRAAAAPALAPPPGVDAPPLTWHGAVAGTDPDWDGARAGEWGADVVAFSVAGGGAALYCAFNPHPGPVPLTLPPPPRAAVWARAIDTALAAPEDATPEGGVRLGGDYELGAKAALVVVAVGAAPAK